MCKTTRCKRNPTKKIGVMGCESLIGYGPYTAVPPNPSPNPDPDPPAPISEITIIPTINRYFYIPQSTINLSNGATIPAILFYDDNENQVEEFVIFSPNGYLNLHINGVIQEGGFYQVDSNSITINPVAGVIFAGTPIIVESLGFTAELVNNSS